MNNTSWLQLFPCFYIIFSAGLQSYVTQQKDLETKEILSRQCIYCRDVLTGKLAEIFSHLSSVHGFSLGNADNIVFGSKLLDVMEQKMKRYVTLPHHQSFSVDIS